MLHTELPEEVGIGLWVELVDVHSDDSSWPLVHVLDSDTCHSHALSEQLDTRSEMMCIQLVSRCTVWQVVYMAIVSLKEQCACFGDSRQSRQHQDCDISL